jgi:NADH dehydrogenase
VRQIRSALDRPERYVAELDASTAIIHLAARVGNAKVADFTRDNVEGTRTIVRAAEERGVAGLVNVSSIAAKFPETAYYPYADSKREAEAIVAACRRPWVTIRPTIVLGTGSPIWTKLRQLARGPLPVVPGSPSTRIQPIHVDDLAAVLLEVAASGLFDREVYELGGGETVTMEEFLKRVHERLTGRRGLSLPVPLALGMPLLRAFERVSPVPLPVTEGQLSSFLYDGVVTQNELQDRFSDRLRGVDAILEEIAS